MQKDLQYALVTSSALPNEIQESEHYISIDKEQWLDLVDYSTEVVKTDESQEILFLIVAKGTEDQQEKDDNRRAQKDKERFELNKALDDLSDKLEHLDKESCECKDEKGDLESKNLLLEKQLDEILGSKNQLKDELSKLQEAERLEKERTEQQKSVQENKKTDLRSKSISLFNALYKK